MCCVDCVEEALSALLPMLPGVHYFRFSLVDDHCGIELDEKDPIVWLKLEDALDEYVVQNQKRPKQKLHPDPATGEPAVPVLEIEAQAVVNAIFVFDLQKVEVNRSAFAVANAGDVLFISFLGSSG
ncbi:unnamed protein product [Fraxinus pennsylvanica]|uniref:Uncharacterized protein n=1 Tax=Fraxinus pennsylvanica TaxID=56036 RepID=A0AAD2E0S2_9LAMI|nr:unnamed protein product [Fraxinus pennsylvanica]